MSKLAELLKRLGAEAELANAYEENPQQIMKDAGLSGEEMKLLREGDRICSRSAINPTSSWYRHTG